MKNGIDDTGRMFMKKTEADRKETKKNTSRKKSRKRKRVSRILSDILLVVLIVVFVYSAYHFYLAYREYKTGDERYEQINEAIVVLDDTAQTQETSAETGSEETAAEDESTAVSAPALEIDYAALKAQNSDFVGVLYIPALGIYYPMAQSHDNDEYLHHLFTGEENVYGCIFLDKDANRDWTSLNSFIYGHNMKNGSMFGTLKRFEREEGLCDSDPYVYIYTEQRVYKYHIFSYYQCLKDDPLYQGVSNEEEYDKFVADSQSKSEYTRTTDTWQDDFSNRPPLITLSTCVNVGETYHFIVVAALVGTTEQ
jgi:sortase B